MKKLSLKSTLILILAICFVGGIKAQATKADQSLWGFWQLVSIEQMGFDEGRITNAQKNDVITMLMAENTSIQDIFTAIHFFDDFTVGICSYKKEIERIQEKNEFLPQNINTKGLYQLNQNKIKINIPDEEGIEFGLIYKVNNKTLEIIFQNAEKDEREEQKMVFIKID